MEMIQLDRHTYPDWGLSSQRCQDGALSASESRWFSIRTTIGMCQPNNADTQCRHDPLSKSMSVRSVPWKIGARTRGPSLRSRPRIAPRCDCGDRVTSLGLAGDGPGRCLVGAEVTFSPLHLWRSVPAGSSPTGTDLISTTQVIPATISVLARSVQ